MNGRDTFLICLVKTFADNFAVYVLGYMIGPVLGLLKNNKGGNGRLVRLKNMFGDATTITYCVLVKTLVNSTTGTRVTSTAPTLVVTLTVFIVTFMIVVFAGVRRPRRTPISADLVGKTLDRHRFTLNTLTVFLCVDMRMKAPACVLRCLASGNVPTDAINLVMTIC